MPHNGKQQSFFPQWQDVPLLHYNWVLKPMPSIHPHAIHRTLKVALDSLLKCHSFRCWWTTPLIAWLMGPTWGSSGADMIQVGTMLAPWTVLSGSVPACYSDNASSLAHNTVSLVHPRVREALRKTAATTASHKGPSQMFMNNARDGANVNKGIFDYARSYYNGYTCGNEFQPFAGIERICFECRYILTYEVEKKCLSCCRRHSAMIFFPLKCLYCDWNFTEVCS